MNRIESTSKPPQWFAAAGVLVLVLLLAACKMPQTAESQEQPPAAPDAVTQESAMDSKDDSSIDGSRNAVVVLESGLRKGMAYGDFRKLVLVEGWEPVVNPQCKANLVGEDAEAFCAKKPQLTSCKICDELPELDSCSSDAHCLVRFRHPGSASVLQATGYGEVEYWSDTGEDAGLQVSSWEFIEPQDR